MKDQPIKPQKMSDNHKLVAAILFGLSMLCILILVYFLNSNFDWIYVTRTQKAFERNWVSPDFTPPPYCVEVNQYWTNPLTGMNMTCVPAGEFKMGNEYGNPDEQPIHSVFLDTFWIDQYEVTNDEYRLCVESRVCVKPRIDYLYQDPAYGDHPVVFVNWFQAASFCQWMGGQLPTEAQWEKAARGVEELLFPWGTIIPECTLGNFGGCVDQTVKVGSYPDGINSYQIYDLLGNVMEWTWDWYDKHYYQSSPTENPTGPLNGTFRSLRGPSYMSSDTIVRNTVRFAQLPTDEWMSTGFRCVINP